MCAARSPCGEPETAGSGEALIDRHAPRLEELESVTTAKDARGNIIQPEVIERREAADGGCPSSNALRLPTASKPWRKPDSGIDLHTTLVLLPMNSMDGVRRIHSPGCAANRALLASGHRGPKAPLPVSRAAESIISMARKAATASSTTSRAGLIRGQSRLAFQIRVCVSTFHWGRIHDRAWYRPDRLITLFTDAAPTPRYSSGASLGAYAKP